MGSHSASDEFINTRNTLMVNSLKGRIPTPRYWLYNCPKSTARKKQNHFTNKKSFLTLPTELKTVWLTFSGSCVYREFSSFNDLIGYLKGAEIRGVGVRSLRANSSQTAVLWLSITIALPTSSNLNGRLTGEHRRRSEGFLGS